MASSSVEVDSHVETVLEESFEAEKDDDAVQLKSKPIKPSDLMNEVNEIANEVAGITGVNRCKAVLLLAHFKWNKEVLLEKYYEDVDALMIRARLAKKDAVKPETECGVCFDNKDLSGPDCGHRTCAACWKQYIDSKITKDGVSEIECTAPGCHLLVEQDQILQHIDDERTKGLYTKLFLNSFVKSSKVIRWCANPKCENALKVSAAEDREVQCSCGTKFCFGCGEEKHIPINCERLRDWKKKCGDDNLNKNWLMNHTKECPKCHVTMEKNGGCNHMTCRSQTCRYEFCWICLGDWKSHGTSYYQCNRFNDAEGTNARNAQDKARAKLKKELHYYTRYMAHDGSLKLEAKLTDTIQQQFKAIQSKFNFVTASDVQYMTKAVDVLALCRQTLKYTYAFAYYLVENNEKKLFEDNQKDVEIATEQLSEILETDHSAIQANELKDMFQKVQDKSRYLQHRRRVLLKHVEEGHDRDTWKFEQ